MSQTTDAEVAGIMAELGIPDLGAFFALVRRAPFPQAKELLERAQTDVGRAWKRLARELHPDVTGNDPEKTERFRRVAEVVEHFRALKVSPPRPVFQPVFVFSFSAGGGFATTNVNTWTSAGGGVGFRSGSGGGGTGE